MVLTPTGTLSLITNILFLFTIIFTEQKQELEPDSHETDQALNVVLAELIHGNINGNTVTI